MPFLTSNCGYTDKDVAWCPISGLYGDNIKKSVDKKKCPWYEGPNFLDLID